MNIGLIKTRAKEELNKNKEGMIRVVLIISLLSVLPTLFSDTDYSWIGIVLSVIFIPLEFAFVYTGLLYATGCAETINEYDSLVGVKNWFKLIGTYICRYIYVFAYSLLPGLFFCFCMSFVMTGFQVDTILLILAVVFGIILCFVAIGAFFKTILTMYLYEDYGLKNMTAVRESSRLMKGHVGDLLRLYLSFLPWIILHVAIMAGGFYFLQQGLPQTVAVIVSGILGMLFATYTYLPLFNVSLAVFYKEIAYHAYH